MSPAKAILQDLKDKRLWPVPVILVAALVAIPMTIGKPGVSTAVVDRPAIASNANAGPELTLTRSTTTGFTKAPRVNDKELDPFGARTVPAKYKIATAKLASATSAVIDSDGGSSSDTTTTTSGGGGTSDPTPSTQTDPTPTKTPTTTTPKDTTPKVETVTDDVISVLVTPDGDENPTELTDVRTLSPLPDADNPFLVYVGRTGDGDAQFIVSSNATATGAGSCSPTPADCSTLTLAVGATEVFVVTGTDATGAATTTKVSITVTDLATKKVPVDDGTDETAVAARYEARSRVIGAKVLKGALGNPQVAKALIKNQIKIRK